MSRLPQDIRYALRRLRNASVVTVLSVVTMALGIGANTAIFTLVHAVMLRDLPVARPAQLYRVGSGEHCCVIGGAQGDWGIFSYQLYRQFRDHTSEFSYMAAFQAGLPRIGVRRNGATASADPYVSELVSGNYFLTFGLHPFVGRTITPEDDRPDAPPVAVMSYRTWQQHFDSDPAVVGATFSLNTQPFTVVGIAPPDFFGDQLQPDPPDFWLPLSTEPLVDGRTALLNQPDAHWLYIIGRLKGGAGPPAVQSELTAELQNWLATRPANVFMKSQEIPEQRILLIPGGGGIKTLATQTSSGLNLLMMIAGLVLLLACANVANLLLARAAAARSEIAIRLALGASTSGLMKFAMSEGLLLALMGGLAGLFVAYEGARAVLLLAFRGSHYIPISASPSLPVVAFAFVLVLLTGLIFSIAPAWIASHSDPADALRGAGRATRDRSSLPRRALVVLQVAFSAILLITAGLLTQSLRNLENQKFGFDSRGRYIVRVSPVLAGYNIDRLADLYRQLDERLPRISGVLSASYSIYSPMSGDNWSHGINIEGHPPDERVSASWDRVGPHYFETIGTRLLRGRLLDQRDITNATKASVINETFARRFFPNDDAIGKHFGSGGPNHSADLEIVGIVQDAKYQDARRPAYATYFVPFVETARISKSSEQQDDSSQFIQAIELYVARRPEHLEADVRQTLSQINRDLIVMDMTTLDEQVAQNFNQDRLIARLTELFGALAVILACVGLYGITADSVTRRTSEIGIRMALGATRSDVLRLILRSVMAQLIIGLAAGIPVVLASGRLLATRLYGVKSYDPSIFATAVGLLTVCAIVAGFVPARGASTIDPIRALRRE